MRQREQFIVINEHNYLNKNLLLCTNNLQKTLPMYTSSKEIIDSHVSSLCGNDNIIIIDKINDVEKLPETVKMESYAITILYRGKASFFVDGESHEMRENNLFVFRPNITLKQTMLSADAKYHITIITQQYAQSLIAADGRNVWEILLFLADNPVVELSRQQAETFEQFHNLIKKYLQNPQTPHNKEITNHLFMASLYDFHDIIEQRLNAKHYNFSSAEMIFRKFYKLLNNTSPKRQKVEYYAAQLNISPKYFSNICKQLTGKSALQHINDAVIKDITILLKDEKFSIKQIAQFTGFPNQSFLGSFTRKHLGISPYKYRKQFLLDNI